LNQEIKTLTQTNVTQKPFQKLMEGSHLEREDPDLIALAFSTNQNKLKIQRYLQEALLLSNRQNPKKESKEDEKK